VLVRVRFVTVGIGNRANREGGLETSKSYINIFQVRISVHALETASV